MTEPPIIWPANGRYLLAVSGGADSMVLLDLMAQAAGEHGYQLHIGHVDHGLRAESSGDRQFVEAAAKRYGLPFAHVEARLERGTSEATARSTRHDWLEAERARVGAVAVVTAHHQDDLAETSILNLARGTGRRGLAPMQDAHIIRPLLGLRRSELRQYAAEHAITWVEDATNQDLTNPRNLLRHSILANAAPDWIANYVANITQLAHLNGHIEESLQELLKPYQLETSFSWPIALIRELSAAELAEVLLAAARELDPTLELSSRLVRELTLFAQTALPGRRRPISPHIWLNRQSSAIELKRAI